MIEQNKIKTDEILQEMEGVEDSPHWLKDTHENQNKNTGKGVFGKIGGFSSHSRKESKKIKPVMFEDDDFFDPR